MSPNQETKILFIFLLTYFSWRRHHHQLLVLTFYDSSIGKVGIMLRITTYKNLGVGTG